MGTFEFLLDHIDPRIEESLEDGIKAFELVYNGAVDEARFRVACATKYLQELGDETLGRPAQTINTLKPNFLLLSAERATFLLLQYQNHALGELAYCRFPLSPELLRAGLHYETPRETQLNEHTLFEGLAAYLKKLHTSFDLPRRNLTTQIDLLRIRRERYFDKATEAYHKSRMLEKLTKGTAEKKYGELKEEWRRIREKLLT